VPELYRPTPRQPEAVLQSNLEGVRRRLKSAAERVDRPVPTLVAVTKYVSSPIALALHRLGCPDLAENRADAFLAKADDLAAAGATPTWHFVGHIQRNKARRVLERADVIHSIDSVRLAETVVRITDELARDVEVFAQVNLTGEPEKQGMTASEARAAVSTLARGAHVRVLGLMAMGPLEERATRTVDEVFHEAADLARDLEAEMPEAFADRRCQLSMGMTGDVEVAIAHGSDFVRIGSALFAGIEQPAHGPQQAEGDQHA
jgi:hypothetical protein